MSLIKGIYDYFKWPESCRKSTLLNHSTADPGVLMLDDGTKEEMGV